MILSKALAHAVFLSAAVNYALALAAVMVTWMIRVLGLEITRAMANRAR